MINKEKNQNLQITLSKQDYFKLLEIQNELSTLLSIELNKSQVIAFLIKNHNKQPSAPTATKAPRITPTQAPKPTNNGHLKPSNPNVNYQAQVIALKDKLNVSFPRLAEILQIPLSTLKKYAYGTQNPTGENEQILINALARYGIK